MPLSRQLGLPCNIFFSRPMCWPFGIRDPLCAETSPSRPVRGRPTVADVGILLRAILTVGLFSRRRRRCWRLLSRTLRRAPHAFAWAVAQVVKGEHLIRYTEEVVVPRLQQALEQVRGERLNAGVDSPPLAQSAGVAATSAAPRALIEAVR